MTAIKLTRVKKQFKHTRAVANVSLRIPKKSFFGIVGPNGAGKSTLIGMIAGLMSCDSGRIQINGKYNAQLKNVVGILAQDAGFYPTKTPRYHLEFWSRLQGFSAVDAWAEARRLLKLTGLDYKQNAKVYTLSNGMRKLLSVASALIGDPDIVILDEPLVGLDPKVKHTVKQLLLSYKGKKTIVICSHQLQEMEFLCDHIAIMREGKMVIQENLGKLLQRKTVLHIKPKNDKLFLKKWGGNIGFRSISASAEGFFVKGSSTKLKKLKAQFAKDDNVLLVAEGKTLEKAFLDVVSR